MDVASSGESGLSHAALLSLVEHAPDGVFVANLEGRYVYVNDAGCRMLGLTRAEVMASSIFDLIPPQDMPRLMKSREVMLKGQSHAAEWRLRRKDGSWLPVEVHANILPEGLWQGFVRDISERKAHRAQLEEHLRRTESDQRWLRAVLDKLPLAVLLFEPGGTLSTNSRADQLFGAPGDPSNETRAQGNGIFLPDGRPVPLEEQISARVLHQGETILGEEYLIRRADGTETHVLGSAAPIHDASGQVIGGVAAFQDLSERMHLERTVRESERLLKAVFDILPVGIWIADKTGRLVDNNPAARRIWGGARHVGIPEFDQYKGWRVDSGRPIAAEEWGMARAITRGETSTGELVRIQCFDGSFKTIIHSAAPLWTDDGGIAGAIVVNEDISALYEAQEKLRASEQVFRTVFDLLPVGVWIADKAGHITLGNPAGHQLWQGIRNVGPDQFSQYRGWWVETGRPIAPNEWALARAISRGETSRAELIRIQCFDDTFKTVVNWGAPILSSDGEITGAVAVNEDVTALYQSQEQLRAAVRDREEMLAVVAHDLRNPLGAVMMSAEVVEQMVQKTLGADAIRRAVSSIIETTRGMATLVDDLLAIAVDGPGRSMLKIEPVNAHELLSKAAAAAEPRFARAGIELEATATSELPALPLDANRILRVFANLLDNALKFTEAHGQTVLRAETVTGAVRFCVGNSGPALGPQELEKMFQPFWQAGRQDRRGAGLGLAICRAIIEAHGGSIWAEPAPGMRVRICLLLPSAGHSGRG